MRLPLALLLCVSLLALGCGSAPPPPAQFALDYVSMNPAPTVPAAPGRLGVAAFEAKAFYNRQRVAWRDGDQHDYYASVRWETVPRVLLTEAVLGAARARGAFTSVQPHPATWGEPPTLVIRGRVEAFDVRTAGDGREAYIAARVALTDGTGRTTLWEGLLESREPTSGNDPDDIVAAFRTAQATLADAIVAQAMRVGEDGAAVTQTAAVADQS